MPWYIPQVPEGIKKRVCIYLLQRYFGQFFEEKLTLDQLSLDLYNGRGTVANVSLDVQALNELGEKQNWPMEFVDGYLEELIINVPWTSILKESSYVEVKGLKLTVQPKQRMESATSMFESMWSSMSNSMQLAQECMKQQAPSTADNSQPLEGIERFAQTIDSILSRVKVTFIDTIIQVEHVPRNSNSGVAIQIKIDAMEYLDEAGNDPPADEASDFNGQEQNKAYVVSSFTSKNLYLEGVSFSTVEFPSVARTFSRSVLSQSQIFSSESDKQDSLVTMIQKSAEFDDNCPENMDTSETKDNSDEQRHVIKFGKISGRQEIRIRMKQSENVSGPKVSIESNFGSFTLFLSPRQVHVLIELANGLWSPDLEDTSNVTPRQKCAEKPMTGLDYQRVEQELQHQIHPLSTFQAPGALQGLHGWSTAPLEESDDDNFLPLKNMSGVTMYDSTTSVVSSSMESSLSSSMASSLSEVNAKSRRRVSNIDSDPTAEISNFQIRLASLALVLLHEDLLTLSTDSSQTLVISSVQQMQNTSKNFFDNLQPVTMHGYGNKDFDYVKDMFETACHLSHLRLVAAPVQIEAKETTTQTAFSVSGKLTAAKLELLECLTNSKDEPFEYVKLLTFSKVSGPSGSPVVTKPSLSLTFKHIEKTVKSGLSRRVSAPKTDVGITLDTCIAEIDITIVDRICALLNPQPVCVINKTVQNVWSVPSTLSAISTQADSKLDVKIMSPSITLTLRFPVPDFRPQHDMQRTPWWKRCVRSDFLTLQLTDVTAETLLQTSQVSQKYTLECRTLDVFYHEVENCTPLHIGKAGVDEKYISSVQDGFNWPRIVLNIYPLIKQDVELEQVAEPEVDLMSQSIYGNLINKKQHGPFSAKRVVHESDTPHARPHKDDSAELIIPGDKQEMNEFIELTTQKARIHLDVTLPMVTAQLLSKHIYEVLYNRINSDLLLWESSAPKPKPPIFDNAIFSGFTALTTMEQDTFAMCKSGIQYDSEDDIDQEQSNVYYSIYDNRMKHSAKNRVVSEPKGQSQFVFNLHIVQGLIGMNSPVRDLATNVIPNQHGEFVLNVEDASVFSVSGYQGDDNLGYVCVQVKSAQLSHCDMISTPSQSPPLMEFGATTPKHLHLTVCKSEPGVLITGSAKDRGGDRDMLAVAIKIQASHETHHVKTVRVAVGINKATLKHRMCPEPNSWITQLIDFFNVFDYPIPGYHAKDVLTEFHLHLWDCAIDYRPLYIPLRSILTLGNFSMSSHLSAQANTSTLRFIAEECGLFLSEKGPPRNGVASLAPVDLQRDFVNVVEVGLFELSLKINDKKTGINPHIDLRASNNQVHIRTCADSGRALMQLLTYLASDGDLSPSDPSAPSGSAVSSPRHQTEQELVKVDPQNISKLSKSQHQHVNELLGEAMKESMSVREGTSDIPNTGAKLFFFPDERLPITDNGKPLPQVTFELGDVTFRSNKSSDTDDDFCFVGDEAGLGILPKNGLPEIRWLTEDPLRIIENHFSIPVGKTDLLKPPEHFPMPVMRYTLCEMSVTWHMYGGNDFKSTDPELKSKKTVNFSDTHISHSVGFSNTHTGEIIFTNVSAKKKSPLDWRIKGGVNREHGVLMELQLNKVRFQHEVYPESTTQASRQVLLITELEIRDRLESSQINKFLYQYTSETRPKQSHANMVVIKAVHIRPDPKLKAQECCLKVSLLPLRLHIDQDSLLFLISFFTELSTASPETEETCQYTSSKHSTPTHQPPIMTVSTENEKELLAQAHKVVDENLLILLEEKRMTTQEQPVTYSVDVEDEMAPIYFRSIIFSPEVPIRLDYLGKRVDMSHGPLPGLLMGLAQLNCSELRLKRLSNRHGLLGFEKLMSYCLHEWLNDIKKNQLPSLLGGVGPIHSLVQLFQGIKDLFWLPIEQYQKDGRIVRGLQRGANSFTKSTVMAALELTSRIIHLVLITAETAYDMMSPGPSVKRTRYSQPQDFREGVANAYMLVKEGIGETADNIVRVATHEREQKGYSGAVGGVLRQIPPTIMKPIIIASEATNNVLGGVRSQLVPDVRREATEKWKNDEG